MRGELLSSVLSLARPSFESVKVVGGRGFLYRQHNWGGGVPTVMETVVDRGTG